MIAMRYRHELDHYEHQIRASCVARMPTRAARSGLILLIALVTASVWTVSASEVPLSSDATDAATAAGDSASGEMFGTE